MATVTSVGRPVRLTVRPPNRNHADRMPFARVSLLGLALGAAPYILVLGLLALTMAAVYQVMGMWGLGAAILPLLLMWLVVRQYVSWTRDTVISLRQTKRELNQSREMNQAYDFVIHRLAAALERRDHPRVGHVERVVQLALTIAEKMGVEAGTPAWQDLRAAALFHDIGEVVVPEAVLRQAGKLTPDQWSLLQQHPTIGHDLLYEAKPLKRAAEIVWSHHERFDGEGYPRGLEGGHIPLGARILAVADAFDAMTSDLAYRRAMPTQTAVEEIRRCRGRQFDPRVVDTFLAFCDSAGSNGHGAGDY